jgi:hypothetical protein
MYKPARKNCMYVHNPLNLTSNSNQSHQPANLQMIEENDLDDLQTDIGKPQDSVGGQQGERRCCICGGACRTIVPDGAKGSVIGISSYIANPVLRR